ncbi:MAG: ribosomal-processing cysteine protease Prp [Clostridia bacterium]|nr:ribosomal-processing cysteine protease Prp [Clostridia bacterium]
MIHVHIESDREGRIVGFNIQGHAGFAPHGKDIVCAAVSAVAQTAAIGLKKYFTHLVNVKQYKGSLKLKVSGDIPRKERMIADAILNTMCWGLKSLEEEYGEYVRVVNKEVRSND